MQTILDIGAIAGPAIGLLALWLAWVVHRRQASSEARDLRIRLRERRDEAAQALERLRELFQEAKRSRKFALAAAGMAKSGVMEKAERQWQADEITIKEMKSLIPDRNSSYNGLPEADLENRYVDLGQTKRRIEHLISRYEDDLRNDDNRRQRIREDKLTTRRSPTSSYE